MNAPKIFTRFVLLLAFFTAQAQNPTKTLTLDEAIRLGLEQSPQLKASIAKHDVSKSKVAQYWNAAAIPNVSLVSGYTRLSDNITPFVVRFPNSSGGSTEQALNPQILNQFTNRISAQQYVFAGGRGINFFKSAELLEKAASLDVEKDRVELRNTIVAAVLNLYKLQTSRTVLLENRQVLRGRLNDAVNFVKAGTAIENDQLRAELALNQLETSLKELENGIEVANFNLDLMLGLPFETRLELDKSSLLKEKNVAALDAYLKSMEQRPDLVAADYRRQATEKTVEIAKGNYFPLVSVGVNYYENRPNQRVFPQEDVFKGTWDAGVTLSFNLSNLYTNKFQIQEAKANVALATAQKSQLADGARMEVATSFYAYNTALEKIGLAEKAIAQATENQRVMKNQYQAQTITIGQLLDADFLVLQAQLNAEAAKADAELAYWKLQKAVGK